MSCDDCDCAECAPGFDSDWVRNWFLRRKMFGGMSQDAIAHVEALIEEMEEAE